MTRLRTITVGGALLLALVLGVLAYLLADAQSDDRADARERFNDIAEVSASVTNGIFNASLVSTQQLAATRLSAPQLDESALAAVAGPARLAYAAVLDGDGRRLVGTATAPRTFGEATQTAIEAQKPRLSDVMQVGGQGVVEWAIPYPTPAGQRIYVQGIPSARFEEFLTSALGDVPNFADAETAMLDGKGVVLGGVRLQARLGEQHRDDELLAALDGNGHGDYGDDRYFAAGAIDNSPFRIVLDTTQDNLYEDVDTTVPWVIFAAFALTGIAGLLLLRRALSSAAELERRQLSERHAVEINDNIIQGLALAKYQLQQGEGEASAAQVAETLREAQRLVSGLLGEAEVQAGQLRREVAAETSRAEESRS